MSVDWYQDVLDFHKKFNAYVGDKPAFPDRQTQELRMSLIQEEVGELFRALQAGKYPRIWGKPNLPSVADGIADSIVVLIGTAIAFGIDLRPIWDEVHKTNMAKIGGGKRKDGKVLKPLGWEGPKLKEILEEQGGEV